MGNISSYFMKLIGLANKEVRLLILGLDSVGKTTILYRMKLGEIVTTIPTIGFNVETLKHKNLSITMWDVGGRDKMRPLFRHYFQNTQALIYVIDSNDKDRIKNASDELHSFLQEDELKDCVVIILANKQDLANCLTLDQVKQEMKFNEIKHHKNAFACVATTGEGLNEPFDWLSNYFNNNNNELIQPLEETLQDAKKIVDKVNESWYSYFTNLGCKILNINNK